MLKALGHIVTEHYKSISTRTYALQARQQSSLETSLCRRFWIQRCYENSNIQPIGWRLQTRQLRADGRISSSWRVGAYLQRYVLPVLDWFVQFESLSVAWMAQHRLERHRGHSVRKDVIAHKDEVESETVRADQPVALFYP